MTKVAVKRTRAEDIRDQMRDDILNGVMKPGQRLTFPDLSVRYGASVGVTREALAALASQGLVQTVAHHGYTVTRISAAKLEELIHARLLIEPQVIEMSVRSGGLDWEAGLMSSYHVLTRTPRLIESDPPRANPEWAQAHEAFHQTLFAACGNDKLLEITRKLGEDALLYRRWSDTLVPSGRDPVAEHKQLLDAAISGNSKLASKLLKEHVHRTADSLVEFSD